MPELPEVETIIRRLKQGDDHTPSVIGQTIHSVEVRWKRIIAKPDPEEFKKVLVGKSITNAKRRGKFLCFPLDQGHLLAHLRMSGDMRIEKRLNSEGNHIPHDKHDRVIINFEGEYRMVFNNIRKFGRMWLVKNPEEVTGNLGPEPLSDEFNVKLLYEKLQAHSRQIKPLLMDQEFIAGLGNLYTNEILYHSKIHPLRQSDTLSKAETIRLHKSRQFILQRGIDKMGSSIDWIYKGGQFQEDFSVYGKKGEPCPRCKTPIKKIEVGQRASYFCPNCQKIDN
jgi:formamidopyrimidine-DNA glycosylase